MILNSMEEVEKNCICYEDVDGEGVFDALAWIMTSDESDFVSAWVSRESSMDDRIYKFYVYTKEYVYSFNNHFMDMYYEVIDSNPWVEAPRNPVE